MGTATRLHKPFLSLSSQRAQDGSNGQRPKSPRQSPRTISRTIRGGASRLVDALLDRGFSDITVLDLSNKAIETSQARLGARGKAVQWVTADAITWQPLRSYDVWHDRAAFHFLTEPEDRKTYARQAAHAVGAGGHVIIGTFALDGPERCSGLPIVRYDAAMIAEILGPTFKLVESRRHDHHTPAGAIQHFQFSRFQRVAESPAALHHRL